LKKVPLLGFFKIVWVRLKQMLCKTWGCPNELKAKSCISVHFSSDVLVHVNHVSGKPQKICYWEKLLCEAETEPAI